MKVLIALVLLAAAGIAAAVLWLTATPGRSHSGALPPFTEAERELAVRLKRHVEAIARDEHHAAEQLNLEQAARYIEATLAGWGQTPRAQPVATRFGSVRNIEVERPGRARAEEIVVIGAHYDSVPGAPGANDNGSGVAATLELARLFAGREPARTLRFVFFVNEESPWFMTDEMGSRAYAERCAARRENVVAMLSLETIGYYSNAPGSQQYPFPLGLLYPSTGNFIGFVANPASRRLMHTAVARFRASVAFPSEGVAAPAWVTGVDWSDHAAFWRLGYPALMVTDTALYRYPYYHSEADTPDKLNYEALARVVTGLQAVVGHLAE